AAKPRRRGRCNGMQADGTYCLGAGETVAEVAQRYGVSTQTLLKANSIRNPRRVVAGQALVIPGYRPKASANARAETPRTDTRSAASTHRVRAGETIGSIADRYGLTPAVL